MSTTPDEPLMIHDSHVKRMELAAIAAYRARYPDGVPWQELSDETRLMWVFYVENMAQPAR